MSFYWITRLDALHNALAAIAVITGVIFIVFLVLAFIFYTTYAHTESAIYEDERKEYKTFKWICIVGGLLFFISVSGTVFVPTTKEMCAIYAVDYLQSNEDAKQLPDKMIKAANAYFDEMASKNTKENKEKQ